MSTPRTGRVTARLKVERESCACLSRLGYGQSFNPRLSSPEHSFNVIVISANRSASLRVVDYDGSSWRIREDITLFDSIGARRLRLLRSAGSWSAN